MTDERLLFPNHEFWISTWRGWMSGFLITPQDLTPNAEYTRQRDGFFSNQSLSNWWSKTWDQIPHYHITVAPWNLVFVSLWVRWFSAAEIIPVWAGSWIQTCSDWTTNMPLQEDYSSVYFMFWVYVNWWIPI